MVDVSDEEAWQWDERRRIEYFNEQGQVIGGEADWIQAEEGPEGWRLLLQMHDYPWVNGAVSSNKLEFSALAAATCLFLRIAPKVFCFGNAPNLACRYQTFLRRHRWFCRVSGRTAC